MTEISNGHNANKGRSVNLNWKIIPLSLIFGLLINLVAFGLRKMMFKGEIVELMFTLFISIMASVSIGVIMIVKQHRNIGWAFIVGAGLTLIFWIVAIYKLTAALGSG